MSSDFVLLSRNPPDRWPQIAIFGFDNTLGTSSSIFICCVDFHCKYLDLFDCPSKTETKMSFRISSEVRNVYVVKNFCKISIPMPFLKPFLSDQTNLN